MKLNLLPGGRGGAAKAREKLEEQQHPVRERRQWQWHGTGDEAVAVARARSKAGCRA